MKPPVNSSLRDVRSLALRTPHFRSSPPLLLPSKSMQIVLQ